MKGGKGYSFHPCAPMSGTNTQGMLVSMTGPCPVRTTFISRWPNRSPTGITILPPIFSCSTSGAGHLGGPGSDDDGVKGRHLLPSVGPVVDLDRDAPVPETVEHDPGLFSQDLDALDGIDFAAQLGQHCGLVPGAGPDLEHTLRACQRQKLGHESDHIGLRHGLVLADRQGVIGVGHAAHGLGQEFMARHFPHGGQYPFVLDAPADDLLLHHSDAVLYQR